MSDRREVGAGLKHYEIFPVEFSQLIGQEAGDNDPPIPYDDKRDFVNYLNALSDAVHHADMGKCCLVCRGNLS
jgi:hypothetical protein